jgi:hypothetical protein
MKFLGSVACNFLPLPFLKVILIGQGCEETLHRLHCAPSADSFKNERTGTTYTPKDCPGFEPDSMNRYPPINTLLSIPFSLLSNLPRLISISKESSSKCQRDLVKMGQEIISLWYWDPPDNKPAHIRDLTDTFEAMRPPDPLIGSTGCYARYARVSASFSCSGFGRYNVCRLTRWKFKILELFLVRSIWCSGVQV